MKPGPDTLTVLVEARLRRRPRNQRVHAALAGRSTGTEKTATLGASVTSDTVTGLTNGRSYQFAVEATNPTGAQSSWLSTTPTTEVAPSRRVT